MKQLYKTNLLLLFVFFSACNQQRKSERPAVKVAAAAIDSCSIDFDIDTVRFRNNLSDCQNRKIYLIKNFEEDYEKINDTARVAIRFFWYRSFNEPVIIRLENRPIIRLSDSSSQREIWQEWFASYKIDIRKLNRDFTIEKGDKYYGRIPPFVFRQGVEVLPVNETPEIISVLDSIRFWQMKPEYLAGPHTDGSSWTLQAYYKGKYHEVTTDMQKHPIKEVCRQLIKLSKYPVKKEDIY